MYIFKQTAVLLLSWIEIHSQYKTKTKIVFTYLWCNYTNPLIVYNLKKNYILIKQSLPESTLKIKHVNEPILSHTNKNLGI